MGKQQFIIGSRAFFSEMPNFNPKDSDYLSFIEKGNGFSRFMQRSDGNYCHFLFVRKSKDAMISDTLADGIPMEIGKFLVPDVAQELGLTIEDLKRLQPLLSRLDKKHEYEHIIYDAYITNGSFSLNDEQLNAAYVSYQTYRSLKDVKRRVDYGE